MTLGKKLSVYRKGTGMTQQQLGEMLNLSPQAISKWENDLAEPDISALRTLSELYHVSLDELIDTEKPFTPAEQAVAEEVEDETEPPKEETASNIGFCKNCGIIVTEENLGTKEPMVLCKKCQAELAEKERLEKAKKEKALAAERAKKRKIDIANRTFFLNHRSKSYIVASLVAIIAAVISVVFLVGSFSVGKLFSSILFIYASFALTFCMFYDNNVIIDVVEWMLSRSIRWPGLIFTFDLDGFAWLIVMKILFAILGFLFGALMTVLGLGIGLVLSIFVFPYLVVRLHYDWKDGAYDRHITV